MAREGEEIRVADAQDESALISAFEGAFAVASVAGPFLEVGPKPVAAAVAVGAHYLDTSVEQGFARLVYEGFGDSAYERDVALLTSFGFDYAMGDLAARLASAELDEPLDEVAVAYAVEGVRLSAGARKTLGHVMARGFVTYDGGLVDSRFGRSTRRVRFPYGERTAVEWGGTEPLTVPRHTRVRRVRSYVRAPAFAAKTGRVAALAAPLVRLTGRIGSGPSDERRRKARFAVVAEAWGPGGACRATLVGSDVYGVTALLIVRGAEVLSRGEARGVGALAPAEAFDAHTLIDALDPLARVDSIDAI
jgi:short subunit dehydrogenase-like uncharacterized protein